MKNIFIFLLLFGIFNFLPAPCEVVLEIRENGYESPSAKISRFGEEILKSTNMPSDVIFEISDSNINLGVDMYNIFYLNKIQIFYETFDYAKNDEELKAILSHKIATIVNNYNTYKFQQEDDGWTFSEDRQTYSIENGKNYSFERLQVRKKDFEADLSAVDIMVKTDINPLTLISVLYHVKSRVQSPLLKQNATLRAVKIYDYLNYNFPTIIKNGYNSEDYNCALEDIEKIILMRDESKKAKILDEQRKIKAERIKRSRRPDAKWHVPYSN